MLTREQLTLGLILLCTAAIYAMSVTNGFVNLDDPLLILGNPHVLQASWSNIAYVFTHFDPELYIPVTFLSYQLPIWMLGLHAWHLHLVSVLLHLGSTYLVWKIAKRLTSSSATALGTATLFALHPINSEAVLWISARKDLLSAFFSLFSILFYLRHRERGGRTLFFWSLGMFVLALGSKVNVILLPVALFLIDNRESVRIRLKTLAPFFVASLIFGIVALSGKSEVRSLLDPWTMMLMTFRSTFFYLTQFVAPSHLAASHAISESKALHSPMLTISVASVCGILALVRTKAKRHKAPAIGLTFFFLMLAPSFAHYTRGTQTFMLGSERYAYLASAGIFFCVASLWASFYHSRVLSRLTKKILLVASILFVLVLAYLTLIRSFVFQDAVIFNIDIVQKNPEDSRAYYNLGVALEAEKRPQEAENAYRLSLNFEPDYLQSLTAFGSLLAREGRTDEARELLSRAIEVRPDSYKGYYLLGVLEEREEDFETAIQNYREAKKYFPDFPELHLRLATVLGKLHRYDEAVDEYQRLAELDPSFRERVEEILREQK